MKNYLAAFLAVFLITSCAEEKETTSNLYDFIPEGSSLLLQSPDFKDFMTGKENVPLFKKNALLGNPEIQEQLKTLSEILPAQKVLVAFIPKDGSLNYLLLSEQAFSLINKDTAENNTSNEEKVRKHNEDGIVFYTGLKNGIWLASNSSNQIEKAIAGTDNLVPEAQNLQLALSASDPAKNSLFVNHNYSRKNLFREINSPFQPVAQWSTLEFKIEEEKVFFNGIATSSPNSPHVLRVFENLGMQNNQAANIVPVSAKGFHSFTYTVFKNLHHNLNNFRKDSVALEDNQLLDYTSEAGVIYSENEKILFLKTTDPQLAKEAFQTTPEEVRNFRGIPIYKNTGEGNSFDLLRPLIPEEVLTEFAFLEEFLIFTKSQEAMDNVITHYLNKTTLQNQEYYQEAISNLADASSLLIVTNTTNTKSFLGSQEEFQLEDYSVAAIQYVQENGFAHVHGGFSTANKTASKELQQISSITLKANAGTRPFLLKNLLNNEIEIAVQDENNLLYLFSGEGELLWEKQLDSRIIGEIHQIDLNSRNNYQLAFSTQNSLQVIDRKGQTVAPFPQIFQDNVTQPLAVFDYDNNNDYRLVITREKQVLMYGPSGKPVRGFNFGEASSSIVKAPKHIRTQNRDYILVPEESGKLNILSRQGRSRISVNETIDFSNNEWYLNEGEFVSVTARGELIRIDEQGNVQRKTLTTEGNSRFAAKDRLLVTLIENVLNINDKTVTLDYGLYTSPEIFELEGNYYISVTDIQARRVFIFNEDAELLPNLPVYGSSAIDFEKVKDNLFFTVQGEENNILLYRL